MAEYSEFDPSRISGSIAPGSIQLATPSKSVASALDRLDHSIERIVEISERTRSRLDPVLHRHPSPSDGDMKADINDSSEDTSSPIQQAVNERADRLNRIANQMAEMLTRIDL